MDSLLPRFASTIAATSPHEIASDPTLCGRLILDTDASLTVTYAPFDYVNLRARVVLVGITPGRQQALAALIEAHRQLKAGHELNVVAKAAKETASFAGGMRSSLTVMLDHIGLHHMLGIASSAELFSIRADLIHYTSALRYPVFVDGNNYSGNPSMVRHPLLRRYFGEYLAAEARALPDAVWIPLGPAPTAALTALADEGVIDRSRIFDGLPHPSGANGERIAYFLGRKKREKLSVKTNADVLDMAKARLLGLVARLSA